MFEMSCRATAQAGAGVSVGAARQASRPGSATQPGSWPAETNHRHALQLVPRRGQITAQGC